jgi:predicted O-linked N-acetylglucosamine transferase (SPINDLY family)
MPAVGSPPALAAGQITFGCLNNFCKVTDRTLELWAPVLRALPTAQLLMVVAPGPHRQRTAEKLGVAPERVQWVVGQPWRQYLATYRRIDICLDTLPFNGGTTSLDAMWMGVPVVTRVGETVVGRAGLSHMHNLGLMELVARTDEEFLQKAVELAGDLDRLGHLRATMRDRMRQSPLMDGPRFARNMEAAYRQMWRAWSGSRG